MMFYADNMPRSSYYFAQQKNIYLNEERRGVISSTMSYLSSLIFRRIFEGAKLIFGDWSTLVSFISFSSFALASISSLTRAISGSVALSITYCEYLIKLSNITNRWQISSLLVASSLHVCSCLLISCCCRLAVCVWTNWISCCLPGL